MALTLDDRTSDPGIELKLGDFKPYVGLERYMERTSPWRSRTYVSDDTLSKLDSRDLALLAYNVALFAIPVIAGLYYLIK